MLKHLRLFLLLVLSVCPLAWAAPPSTLGFQGNLADLNGSPVSATLAITFRLYGVQSGGTELWSETQPGVVVSGGIFTVELGKVTPLPSAVFGKQLYLGIQIAGDSEMAPRPPLTAASYALRAERTMKNTVLVSAEGTATENGATLIAAFAALPTATADAPQTVELDAGTFDLGTASLTVPSYVTLVGRGQDASVITGQQDGDFGVVSFRANSRGREFTVRSYPTSGAAFAIGVHSEAGNGAPVENVQLSHVTALIESAASTDPIDRAGILACMSDSTIEHSTAIARGGSQATGLVVDCGSWNASAGSGLSLQNLDLSASGAGLTVRGASLAGGGTWKNIKTVVTADQSTISLAEGLSIHKPVSNARATLLDSTIEISGGVMATSSVVNGINHRSADLRVRHVDVAIEGMTAQSVTGVGVYADIFDRKLDYQGLTVSVDAAGNDPKGYSTAIGVISDHAGGKLIDSTIDVVCRGDTRFCLGSGRQFSGGNPSQGRLEVDRVHITVSNPDPADAPTASAVAFGAHGNEIAIRDSTFRTLRSPEGEYATTLEIAEDATYVRVERSTLAIENDTVGDAPAVNGGGNAGSSREFYGNTINAAVATWGSATVTCAATTRPGVGFLASTCP